MEIINFKMLCRTFSYTNFDIMNFNLKEIFYFDVIISKCRKSYIDLV